MSNTLAQTERAKLIEAVADAVLAAIHNTQWRPESEQEGARINTLMRAARLPRYSSKVQLTHEVIRLAVGTTSYVFLSLRTAETQQEWEAAGWKAAGWAASGQV